jgi:hypothetical protein
MVGLLTQQKEHMSNWLLVPTCLIALLGFIGYAFYQGSRVSPDRNNTNFGPSNNDGWTGGSDS